MIAVKYQYTQKTIPNPNAHAISDLFLQPTRILYQFLATMRLIDCGLTALTAQ